MSIRKLLVALAIVAIVATAVTLAVVRMSDRHAPSDQVMLILRGVADSDNPRGQLDDSSALEYARRLGFRGEVLDVAGQAGANSPQVRMALERIRRDETIKAIYGFSGGGYNTRLIWNQLSPGERTRVRKVVVIGSPGVTEPDFNGGADVLIKPDPPAGHMAGPRVLLESLVSNSIARKHAD